MFAFSVFLLFPTKRTQYRGSRPPYASASRERGIFSGRRFIAGKLILRFEPSYLWFLPS